MWDANFASKTQTDAKSASLHANSASPLRGQWNRRNELLKIGNGRRNHSIDSERKFGHFYSVQDLIQCGWTNEAMYRDLQIFKDTLHPFRGDWRFGIDIAPGDVTISILDPTIRPVWDLVVKWETFDENRHRGRLSLREQAERRYLELAMEAAPEALRLF